MGSARTVALWALAATLTATAARAQEGTETSTAASDSGDDAALAERGKELYANGQYLEALEAFKEAHDSDPSPALRYNIASCYEKLSQWSEAIKWYELYLEVETSPRDRSDAMDKIELLRKRIGDDTPEGQFTARMEAGRTAYGRGDYEAAILEFQAAFEIKEDPAPLYNLGKSYERLARYEEAIEYYEQYLALAPEAPDRADVEETIKRLRKAIRERYQDLTVSSDPPGGDIYLDDKSSEILGQTNLSMKVTPGPHTIYIILNGYEPVEREFIMPDDKPLALDFKMTPLSNVGELVVNVPEDGARIFVDGAIVGLSPYTQKKKLEQGSHQVQVELKGYYLYTQDVQITKDETTVLDVELKKPRKRVADGTLKDWGTTLMIVGLVGGTLGYLAPFIYQEFILARDYYDPLGPQSISGNTFYRGPDTENGLRTNEEFQSLDRIQIGSLVAGSIVAAGGLSMLMVKWFRKKQPEPVTGIGPANSPWFTFDGVGVTRTPDGGTGVGLSGRF